ncbi:MAG: helix-turn-helix domain-containing protein [Oscillospiraceae bacterium]|nr:helix-turn-helix domain-containing protein [Oscillospiraceae bacterium]
MRMAATAKVIPPIEYTAEEIREIRDNLDMTQERFAFILGVSRKTVEAWEYGKGTPSGPAARLLAIADIDPAALKRYGFAE